MQTLWLARHANRQDFADPDWAATADRPHDPGLSDDGVEQAKQLGRRVAGLGVDRIVSSPFLRAVETAHHVADATDDPIVLEPGLGEWLNDDWFETAPNTLAPSTLAAQFERLVPQQPDGPCRQPTYPESKHRALARLGATGQCLADRFAGETLLLVGHGITVLGVLRGLVGTDVPDSGCPLASLTKGVQQDGTWTIPLRNDTSHLENGTRAANRLV
jgi:broad specificity phosphatase PhoE